MNGYFKMLAADFESFNRAAAIAYKNIYHDYTCGEFYTIPFPDSDPLYLWTRIEHDGITTEPLVSRAAAMAQGMQELTD